MWFPPCEQTSASLLQILTTTLLNRIHASRACNGPYLQVWQLIRGCHSWSSQSCWTATLDLFCVLLPYYHLNNGNNNKNNISKQMQIETSTSTYTHAPTPAPAPQQQRCRSAEMTHLWAWSTTMFCLTERTTFKGDLGDRARGEGRGKLSTGCFLDLCVASREKWAISRSTSGLFLISVQNYLILYSTYFYEPKSLPKSKSAFTSDRAP